MNIPSGRFGLSGLRARLMRLSAQHGLSLDLIGLVASGLLVHLLYLLHIDPAAGEALRIAAESGAVPERTPAIILKDIEQELCLILGLWCVWLLAFRYRLFQDEGYLLELDFLGLDELGAFGEAALDGIETRLAGAEAQLPDSLLLRCTRLALDRIRLGGTFQEANEAAAEAGDLHLEILYSRLSIAKYILWAIPSIGFLGTVRGIGEALGQAGEAMAGDLSGMASSLGIAFNSTFVALFVSLVLMLLSNGLQGREERLAADCKQFVSSRLIAKLSTLSRAAQGGGGRAPAHAAEDSAP